MLFQTLVGAWPLDLDLDDRKGREGYAERLVQWQIKALREAKVSSNWYEPDTGYEERSADFINRLLLSPEREPLLGDVCNFVNQIAAAGAVNSLAQVLMRLTSPGVPDLYQGREFWDFSLVDPDNRVAVDYAALHDGLAQLEENQPISALLQSWRNGRIKQALIARGLQVLRAKADVFAQGQYCPLPVVGPKSPNVVAYTRTSQHGGAVVVVPRVCFQAIKRGHSPAEPCIAREFWGDTHVILPRHWAGTALHDELEGSVHRSAPSGALRVDELLARMPVALLMPD
jgi:(1->4)-alpha-D-glucan 1-alpha-D-glucosylmutase